MHGVPMRIAKLSAQNLIDTLGDNDFFNVVYVSIYFLSYFYAVILVYTLLAHDMKVKRTDWNFLWNKCSSCGNINSKIENFMKIK